ncbi:MAG: glycosyltransferase [Rhodospirillaceae bacterium]
MIATTDYGLPCIIPSTVKAVIHHAPFWGRFGFSPGLLWWLIVRARDYDLIIVHDFHNFCTIAALIASVLCHRPLVIRPCGELAGHTGHRKNWRERLGALLRRGMFRCIWGRWLVRRSVFHFTSQQERESAIRHLREPGLRCFVVPLGISLPPVLQHPVREGNPNERKVLFLSRLHPQKGVEFLIEGFLRALPAVPDASLIIAGGGAPAYVEQLHRQAGGHPNIRFLGMVEPERRERLFRQASLFVLPSYHENFGRAVAEALAHGVPVLVTADVQISGDIVAAGAGEIISRDAVAIASRLAALLQAPNQLAAMSARAVLLAERAYSWPAVGHRLLEYYRAVI